MTSIGCLLSEDSESAPLGAVIVGLFAGIGAFFFAQYTIENTRRRVRKELGRLKDNPED